MIAELGAEQLLMLQCCWQVCAECAVCMSGRALMSCFGREKQLSNQNVIIYFHGATVALATALATGLSTVSKHCDH